MNGGTADDLRSDIVGAPSIAPVPNGPGEDRLTDQSPIYGRIADRADARAHRAYARRMTALAIGSGDIGTYRIVMAVAAEHEARAADLERRAGTMRPA